MPSNDIVFKNINLNLNIEKPKNHETNPKTWYVKKILNNEDILNIVEKLLKNAIQWRCFRKR